MIGLAKGIKDTLLGWYCESGEQGTDLLKLMWAAYDKPRRSPVIGLEAVEPFIAYQEWLQMIICGKPSKPSFPRPEPPFSGGQCENVLYFVTGDFSYTQFNTGALNEFSMARQLPGPIRSVEVVLYPPRPGFPDGESQVVIVYGPDSLEDKNFATTNLRFQTVIDLTNVAVFRVDGQPDTCGNPDPPAELDPVIELEKDIVFEDNQGNTITLPNVPINIFNPVINVNGNLNLTVDIDNGSLLGDLRIGNDFTFELKSPLPPDRRGNEDKDVKGDGEEEPEEELDEDEDEEDEEEEEKILGVFVRSQSVSATNQRQSYLPSGKAPTLVIPYLALVCFKKRKGIETGWSTDIRVKSVNAYIPCPWPEGAVDVSVAWEPAWNGTYVLDRGRVCDCCKEDLQGAEE